MSHNNLFGCPHKCINCGCDISCEENEINNGVCDSCHEIEIMAELYNDEMKENDEND